MVQRNREAGRLQFGSTEDAIDRGQCIFICVGTPPLENGDADLSAIEGVARTIAKRASGYRLIIEKSTVPVQTGAQLRKHLSQYSANGLEYDVVSNPEFLREGSAVEDFSSRSHRGGGRRRHGQRKACARFTSQSFSRPSSARSMPPVPRGGRCASW